MEINCSPIVFIGYLLISLCIISVLDGNFSVTEILFDRWSQQYRSTWGSLLVNSTAVCEGCWTHSRQTIQNVNTNAIIFVFQWTCWLIIQLSLCASHMHRYFRICRRSVWEFTRNNCNWGANGFYINGCLPVGLSVCIIRCVCASDVCVCVMRTVRSSHNSQTITNAANQ